MVALALAAAMTGWTTVSAQGGIFSVAIPQEWTVLKVWRNDPKLPIPLSAWLATELSNDPFAEESPHLTLDFVATSRLEYRGSRDAVFVVSCLDTPLARKMLNDYKAIDTATAVLTLAKGQRVLIFEGLGVLNPRMPNDPLTYVSLQSGNGRHFFVVTSFGLAGREENETLAERLHSSFKLGKAPRRIMGPD